MIRRSEEKQSVRKPAPFNGVGEITVRSLLELKPYHMDRCYLGNINKFPRIFICMVVIMPKVISEIKKLLTGKMLTLYSCSALSFQHSRIAMSPDSFDLKAVTGG